MMLKYSTKIAPRQDGAVIFEQEGVGRIMGIVEAPRLPHLESLPRAPFLVDIDASQTRWFGG